MSRTSNLGKRPGGNGLVAVGIDKVNKTSQYALKWAVDHLLSKGQTIILIHVAQNKATSSYSYSSGNGLVCDISGAISAHKEQLENQTRDLFLTFHCYCTRKDIQCLDITIEHSDVVKGLVEYVTSSGIENLVLGASKSTLMRKLKMYDIPSNVTKGAPDFCTVYVISKTKISSVRNGSRVAPFTSPLLRQIKDMQSQSNSPGGSPDLRSRISFNQRGTPRRFPNANDSLRSPLARGRCPTKRNFNDQPEHDTDISFLSPGRPSTDISVGSSPRPSTDISFVSSSRPSTDISFVSSSRPSTGTDISFVSSSRPSSDISFVSSGRPSTDIMSSMFGESIDSGRSSRVSNSSDSSFESTRFGAKATDASSMGFSSSSLENEEVENEMRRLKLELQKTMELYSTACKEAISAQQKAEELQRWRIEEDRRIEEAKQSEGGALDAIDKQQAEHKSALELAEAGQRIAEMESRKRTNVEMKMLREGSPKQNNVMSSLNGFMYRRYPIDEIEEATDYFSESRKVGEGGYGPVFKCYLDHTPVAVKVLRSDADQGMSQFQQEVEVLSCMRHPNLVLLLGACPEYGCLVYEYMANGSLEDRLNQRGDTPALSWQHRFRIAAEIATGLHFLHQTKPEPLVHRDLKPANILLDHNFATKISDVGLARLVPSLADDVTQCCMTSAAGTLSYIDPEYQQTGMLGVKSDVYSLGIVFLQLITGKPAKGLSQYVSDSIKTETFSEILDPAVPDWPVEEAMSLANLALQCAQLMRKDRPDLGKVVLPELNRLRELANESL